MINTILKLLKKQMQKRKMQKQFKKIAKWQEEMYNYKTYQEFEDIH